MKRNRAEGIYLLLAGIFIASLVSCNLMFQKFFHWNFFGLYTFEISVGILPYPITFLVTDIISEIYGKKRADRVVKVGIFASVFVLLVVTLADVVPATSWSPVNGKEFNHVFGLTGLAVGASMVAYLLAQFIDIRIFHFWKGVTNGKHLWLRNNFSTIGSQFIDTSSVLLLLCLFGAIDWGRFDRLLINGFLFKMLIAIVDTPLIYLSVFGLRRYFQLQPQQELDF